MYLIVILLVFVVTFIVAEAAEAKFKEVMVSYEAIKTERKNMNL